MDFFDCVIIVQDEPGWSKWIDLAYLIILFLILYLRWKAWPVKKKVIYIIIGFFGLILVNVIYFYLFPSFVCG